MYAAASIALEERARRRARENVRVMRARRSRPPKRASSARPSDCFPAVPHDEISVPTVVRDRASPQRGARRESRSRVGGSIGVAGRRSRRVARGIVPMGVFARPALGRVTKVLERLVSAVGETTGVSSTRHARGRPRGDFARVSSSADARDALRDADTRRSLRRPPRSDPRLDPARGRRRRGRDVPHGTARGFAALAASPPRREGSDGDLPTGVRATAGVDAATASESGA